LWEVKCTGNSYTENATNEIDKNINMR